MGSPPRGRGKGIFAILALSATGITPAWAGKRCLNDLVDVDWQDHPRVGGEKEWTVHYHRQTEGSPPRGRGKGIKRSSHAHQTGITPAWAGKSRSFISFHFFGEDHPRVGGEKLPVFSICAGVSGSPPRGRGKVTRLYALADLEGITPAWAGKSCGRAAPRAQKRDHPRVGGEKTKKIP